VLSCCVVSSLVSVDLVRRPRNPSGNGGMGAPKCVDLAADSLICRVKGCGSAHIFFIKKSRLDTSHTKRRNFVHGLFRSASGQLNCGIDLEIWRQLVGYYVCASFYFLTATCTLIWGSDLVICWICYHWCHTYCSRFRISLGITPVVKIQIRPTPPEEI